MFTWWRPLYRGAPCPNTAYYSDKEELLLAGLSGEAYTSEFFCTKLDIFSKVVRLAATMHQRYRMICRLKDQTDL